MTISEARDVQLLQHRFGCGSKFADLLGAVGIESTKSTQVVVINRVKGVNDYVVPEYIRCNDLLGSISRTARIGIDFTANRAGQREEHSEYWAGDLIAKMPPRAGKVMHAVLEDPVDLANKRIASGWQTMPIAYGSRMAAQRLDVRHSAATEALHALARHEVIERVRRLKLLGSRAAARRT